MFFLCILFFDIHLSKEKKKPKHLKHTYLTNYLIKMKKDKTI